MDGVLTWAAVIKYHRLGDLEIYFSWLWRLEVPDPVQQGLVSGGKSLPSLWSATSSLWPHMAFPLSTYRKRDITLSSSSYEATNPMELGPHTSGLI